MIRYIAASCRGSDANTTAAAAADNDDDDASQCDVIATYPEHLLLSSMDSCPATRFVLYFTTIIVILISMVMAYAAGHLCYVTSRKLDILKMCHTAGLWN